MPVFWKHHLTENFIKHGVPTYPNGVGAGGHLYKILPTEDDGLYYYCPIELDVHEYIDYNETFVKALVTKFSNKPFSPLAEIKGRSRRPGQEPNIQAPIQPKEAKNPDAETNSLWHPGWSIFHYPTAVLTLAPLPSIHLHTRLRENPCRLHSLSLLLILRWSHPS